MAKSKKSFVCTACGVQVGQWQGQCSACKAWNTLESLQESPSKKFSERSGFAGLNAELTLLKEVAVDEIYRFTSGSGEFDRALGGGFVPGSVVLIGGHPGAGKSTLLLQSLCFISTEKPTLYVSGEESLQQIAARAMRLELSQQPLHMLAETSIERILDQAQKLKPAIIVIDSIQVMYQESLDNAPGSVTQVREATTVLTRFAKRTGTVLLLVGHITKDNTLAGPMALSHIVDTQLMLSTTDDSRFRVLRTTKNRFGQVNELGIFAMLEKGLKGVKNPSAIFLSRTDKPIPGSAVSVLWEGTRPLLIEIQALLADSQLNNPRRIAVGLEQNRMAMLLAVLSRHGQIVTADQDVFINVVGGVRVFETSADLACLLAMLSSLRNIALDHRLVVFGEVGLSGEIRPVSNGQERLQEAAKHGFKQAIVPKANNLRPVGSIEIISIEQLTEALDFIN